LSKHPRKLGNDNVREGSRLSSASKPPQSSQEPPVAVVVEVIPENTDKMNAPVQTMVFGGMEATFLRQMAQHSVEEKCTKNDGGKWAANEFWTDEYYNTTTVRSVETPIPGKNVVSNTKHEGSTLQQYCAMGAAKDAHLNEADVVVPRLYAARLFRSLDKALRDKEGLEEWATCIAVIKKSVVKLMKNAPPGWLMCCW
jgi:hypothetical protein